VGLCGYEVLDDVQIVFFESPDLYHRSPDFGELPYKSWDLKTAVWSLVAGGGGGDGAARGRVSRRCSAGYTLHPTPYRGTSLIRNSPPPLGPP